MLNKKHFFLVWMLCCVLTILPLHLCAEEETTVERPFLHTFTATDIDGNEIDQSIFADYNLTMVNVWATYCNPCISEMPDLGKLQAAYAEHGVQIIGIVSDTLNMDGTISEDQVDLAREIIQVTGAAYPHLLPSQDLINIVLWQINAVPTTFFVDNNGALVGYAYEGSRSYEAWTQIIDETIKLL